jgi:hypothetical protein
MSELPIGCVLLDRFVAPDMAKLAGALRARHPELQAEATGRSPIIRCGDYEIAVMSMPAPIGPDPGIIPRAETIWPEAGAVVARHKGHVIVSVLGKDKSHLPVGRMITAVIGALIAVTPECCAVTWGATILRSAKLWEELSRRSFAPFPDYPFGLWVDILPFRSDPKIGAVTMGLSAFVGREIEFESATLDVPTLIHKVSGLSIYLIEHGAVVKDGDAVGASEQERFIARHQNSARFGGMPILFCSAS